MIQDIKIKRKLTPSALPPRPPHLRPRLLSRRWLLVVGVLIILIAVAYFSAVVFGRVVVEIVPTSLNLVLADTLVASRSSTATSTLTFDTVTLPEKTLNQTVPTTATTSVSRPASGQVVIYNNFSSAPQKLIANTRLQAKNGKIYRIREAVTVPGLKPATPKAIPGSVEVTVYADQPGAEYNSAPVDFTIPGFKGDSRFDKFFGRSKTALAGGFVGEARQASPEALAVARAELRRNLTAALLKEARFQIPARYVLFKELALVNFRETIDQNQITEVGELRAVILPRETLALKLTAGRLPAWGAAGVSINNLESLSVTSDALADATLGKIPTISLNVKGSARVLAAMQPELIVKKLAGLPRSEVGPLLSAWPGVAEVRPIFQPFWLWRVPMEATRIEVKLPVS